MTTICSQDTFYCGVYQDGSCTYSNERHANSYGTSATANGESRIRNFYSTKREVQRSIDKYLNGIGASRYKSTPGTTVSATDTGSILCTFCADNLDLFRTVNNTCSAACDTIFTTPTPAEFETRAPGVSRFQCGFIDTDLRKQLKSNAIHCSTEQPSLNFHIDILYRFERFEHQSSYVHRSYTVRYSWLFNTTFTIIRHATFAIIRICPNTKYRTSFTSTD